MCNSEIWGCFTLKTPLKLVGWAITSRNTIIEKLQNYKSQNPKLNNSETERDKGNMSINHDNETGVALSDAVNKTCGNAP